MDTEKRIINWLLIILFAAIDLILIPILFYDCFPNYKDALGAILTFAGAIIGGALTLIGVRSTLKHQYLNDYPEKYRGVFEANSYMEFVVLTLSSIGIYQEEEKAKTLEMLKEISSNRDVIYKNTSKASIEAYEKALHFFQVVQHWETTLILSDGKVREINHEWWNELNQAKNDFKIEFEKYKTGYEKLRKSIYF